MEKRNLPVRLGLCPHKPCFRSVETPAEALGNHIIKFTFAYKIHYKDSIALKGEGSKTVLLFHYSIVLLFNL